MNAISRIDTVHAGVVAHHDQADIQALAERIDTRSPLTIACFGQEIGQKTSDYADSLLAQARAQDLDQMGSKLNEVVIAAQKFDLESFDNKLTRIPLIGKVIAGVIQTKTRAMSQFNSLEGQITKLVDEIGSAQHRLAERAMTLDTMYRGVEDEQHALGLHAEAAQVRLQELEAQLTAMPASDDPIATEHRAALDASRAALSKRVGDLRVLQHAALQTLPMIRMVQANNMVLVEKFQTIRNLTVPAWKRAFMMALALHEQKDAVALANQIDNATNYFMVRNSEILHENAVATAKANQRMVIDVDTLRKVHSNVVQTLIDVRKANDEGVALRVQALNDLSGLRQELQRNQLTA